MNNLQRNQLIVALRDPTYEEERRITAINDLSVCENGSRNSVLAPDRGCNLMTFIFKKIAHACSTGKHELSYILDDLRLGLGCHRRKPFRKTDLA